MQDPFADKSNDKFHREVQMWMTVLMCLLVAFLYLAVKRMTGSQEEIPAHILQSSVAQVAPPIDYESARALPPKPPALTGVPPIKSGSFVVNGNPAKPNVTTNVSPGSPPDFGFPAQAKPTNRFAKVSPKQNEASGLDSVSPSSPFPQPSFLEPEKVETVDAAAEAIGRRRAKQLAAMTRGLPERLNRIQSSVEQATVELPVKAEVKSRLSSVANNGFVENSPLKPVVQMPLKPAVQMPLRYAVHVPLSLADRATRPLASEAPVKPAKVMKPFQPAVTNTFALNPVADSPALEPVPNTIEPGSAKELPKANSFVPLPSLRPIAQTQTREVAVEVPRIPKVVEQPSKPAEIVNPIKPIPHPSPNLKRHVVQAGDSFFTIAQQHYGDAQWFRALRLANQAVVSGGELSVGTTLSIPTAAQLAKQFPEHAVRSAVQRPTEAGQRIYVTQAGDTLFDIARRKTGQGSRFSEIISSNEFRLPAKIRASDELPEGLRLVLPESTLQ